MRPEYTPEEPNPQITQMAQMNSEHPSFPVSFLIIAKIRVFLAGVPI